MKPEFNEFDSVNDVSSLDMADSRDLIDRARNGCDASLTELISSLRGYLLVIANEELNDDLRAKIGASDLVQSVLFQADRNLAEFRGDSKQTLLAWLRKILTNEIIAAHRRYVFSSKRDIRREVALPSDSGLGAAPLAFSGHSPHSDAELNEDALRLRNAMQRLSDDHRTVVVLRNWEQLRFEEIGRRMTRSTDAVKKLWKRAIQQLEKELNDEQGSR